MDKTTAYSPRSEYPTDLHRLLFGNSATRSRVHRLVAPLTFPADSINEPSYPALLKRVSETTALAAGVRWEPAIRELLAQHLDEQALSGLVLIDKGRRSVATGLAIVCGTAIVEVTGDAIVIAVGQASITARGVEAQVFASDNAKLALYDGVRFYAEGQVEVNSNDRVHGRAVGFASGNARGESVLILGGNARFDAMNGSFMYGEEDARIRCFGNSQARIRTRAFAQLFDNATGWFEGESSGEAAGHSRANVKEPAKVKVTGQEARIVTVEYGKSLTTRDWPNW